MSFAILQRRRDGAYIVVKQSSGQSPDELAEEHNAFYNSSFDTKEQAEARAVELRKASHPEWT